MRILLPSAILDLGLIMRSVVVVSIVRVVILANIDQVDITCTSLVQALVSEETSG